LLSALGRAKSPVIQPEHAALVGLVLHGSVGLDGANVREDVLSVLDALHQHGLMDTSALEPLREAVGQMPSGQAVGDAAILRPLAEGITALWRAYLAGGLDPELYPTQRLGQAVHQTMATMVGSRSAWSPSQPGSGTAFDTWARTQEEIRPPSLSTDTTLNCSESVLLAGYSAGVLPWTWIHETYADTTFNEVAWGPHLKGRLLPRGSVPYVVGDIDSPMPNAGDIVVFGRVAGHVALATGQRDARGRAIVLSFGMEPREGYDMSEQGGLEGPLEDSGKLDPRDVVLAIAIDDLVEDWAADQTVEFGPGPWQSPVPADARRRTGAGP
jgi:hypothetical protein